MSNNPTPFLLLQSAGLANPLVGTLLASGVNAIAMVPPPPLRLLLIFLGLTQEDKKKAKGGGGGTIAIAITPEASRVPTRVNPRR